MDNIFATVLITPNPGKMERVKELLITVAKQVEELQETVLQYQLFEEVGREGEDLKEDRKVVVQINFTNGDAVARYHALESFQTFWATIPEENLLAVPLDAKICKVFGGFAGRR